MKQGNAGFTLVELMVASVLGLMLAAVVTSAYLGSKSSFRGGQSLSALQEGGRAALDLLARDIRSAGFRGCDNALLAPVNTLLNPGVYAYNAGVSVQGYEAQGGNWSPALDASLSSATPPPLAGTDVITVRRADGTGLAPVPPYMTSTTADLHVDAPNSINQFDILLVTDCGGVAVFQETAVNPGVTGTISHQTAIGTPGNLTADLQKIFGQDALIYKVLTLSYYIAPSVLSAGNNSLWRLAAGGAPQEMIEGVDNLQVLYGEDTDADRTANQYVSAATVGSMSNVVSVKVSLLMRSLRDFVTTKPQAYSFAGAAAVTPTDQRLRLPLTSVINLRNRTP